ncbi:MAG: alpha/beta hydrolase [Actinobacteria bacterium]|nr:alpha/beta hydrolase [Actinomycetota bacterium]
MTIPVFIPEAKFEVPVKGGNLALFRYGPTGGKPVLLLHGITSSNRAWPFFAKELISRGFTPYAPDLRGRGESNNIEGPFGMAAHAQDMSAIIDFLGFEKMEVIGHSMGAFVGVALIGIYPEKVSRLVFIDGGVLFPLPAGFTVEKITPIILGPALARLSMKFESSEAYRDFWKTNPALGTIWSPELDEYSDYDLQGSPPNLRPRTSVKALEEDVRDEFEGDLIPKSCAGLREEVLLLRTTRGLQNEETPLYPLEALNALLEQFPKITVRTLDNLNHYSVIMSEEGARRSANAIYGEAVVL